jgi:hypothetical protein
MSYVISALKEKNGKRVRVRLWSSSDICTRLQTMLNQVPQHQVSGHVFHVTIVSLRISQRRYHCLHISDRIGRPVESVFSSYESPGIISEFIRIFVFRSQYCMVLLLHYLKVIAM